MAQDWVVSGPCNIYVNNTLAAAGTGGTWSSLGRTTNEDGAKIAINTGVHKTTTTASGMAAEQAVTNNQTATISFVLATIDAAVFTAMRARLNGSIFSTPGTEGTAVVGLPMVGGTTPCMVGVRIVPTIAGRKYYEFLFCLQDGDATQIGPFANQPVMHGITMNAIPNPSNNTLYSTGTTPPS